MRLKCIQRVYDGHLAVRLDCPGRSFPLKENRRRWVGEEMVRLYSNATFKYIHPCIVSAVFTEELCRLLELFVSVDFARGVDVVRESDGERPDLQGRQFDFLFTAIFRLPVRYAKSTATEDEEAEKYRQVASK